MKKETENKYENWKDKPEDFAFHCEQLYDGSLLKLVKFFGLRNEPLIALRREHSQGDYGFRDKGGYLRASGTYNLARSEAEIEEKRIAYVARVNGIRIDKGSREPISP